MGELGPRTVSPGALAPRFEDYRFEIRHLTEEEGGVFLITFPDLPECMSDGETIEDAAENGRDAFRCWMQAHSEDGRPVPVPDESAANRNNQLRTDLEPGRLLPPLP